MNSLMYSDDEHRKRTLCKKCDRTRVCNYFPIVIALVTDQTSATTPIGGTGHQTIVTTTYRKIGTSGAYLCKLCQVRSWIKKWIPLFIGGFLPSLVILLHFLVPEYQEFVGRYVDPETLWPVALIILVFGGILALPYFFLYFLAFKVGSYEEVEKLLAEEVKQNHSAAFVETERGLISTIGKG